MRSCGYVHVGMMGGSCGAWHRLLNGWCGLWLRCRVAALAVVQELPGQCVGFEFALPDKLDASEFRSGHLGELALGHWESVRHWSSSRSSSCWR